MTEIHERHGIPEDTERYRLLRDALRWADEHLQRDLDANDREMLETVVHAVLGKCDSLTVRQWERVQKVYFELIDTTVGIDGTTPTTSDEVFARRATLEKAQAKDQSNQEDVSVREHFDQRVTTTYNAVWKWLVNVSGGVSDAVDDLQLGPPE